MGRFTLKAGAHYARPFAGWPWIGPKSMERLVTFDKSCAYVAGPYNADDANKLFGLSFGFGGVHHNSARFGWRWSVSEQCIELLAYVYHNGARNQDEQLRFPVVALVRPGQRVRLGIAYEDGSYAFSVDTEGGGFIGQYAAPGSAPKNLPGFGLTHSLYFGGVLPAPHAMEVQIDRVS